jgi:hypothetical protein
LSSEEESGVKIPISTEGRVFVAQMIRHLRKRQRLGAALLATLLAGPLQIGPGSAGDTKVHIIDVAK